MQFYAGLVGELSAIESEDYSCVRCHSMNSRRVRRRIEAFLGNDMCHLIVFSGLLTELS